MRRRVFYDRIDAGRELAADLFAYANRDDILVLGLPRGGVPVAFEVAKSLHAPMDVFLVRKLGVPGHEEFAMGAIASGGVKVLNEEVLGQLNIPEEIVNLVAAREEEELRRREQEYRSDRPPLKVDGLTVILVDDGLATGSTMRAAIMAIRKMNPARIVVAVPVGADDTCREMKAIADEVICVLQPQAFFAVGNWYQNFSQTTDGEVRDLLDKASQIPASPSVSA